ncbi:MAG: magnesium chelatase subunit H [Pseudomonadota bacterium]
MPRRTTAADKAPYNVTLVTLDGHLAAAAERAATRLRRRVPGLNFTLHCAGEWRDRPAAIERCRDDIAAADIVIVSMMFIDEHIRAVLPALQARRDDCDAMVCFMSDGEVMKLTRMGAFEMGKPASGPLKLLKRLRGNAGKKGGTVGARQVAMLKRLPRLMRFIPGTAQDVRAYFLTMQYWLAGSEKNIVNLVGLLVRRYAQRDGKPLAAKLKVDAPEDYPETGLYHPRADRRIAATPQGLPASPKGAPTVGLLLMRSYVLAGNTRHYDAVIDAFEAAGIRVLPAFSVGLDARPAVETFFHEHGRPVVDAVVSLTGFSLVGGPAYNDSRAAEDLLAELGVPYLAAHATEFQTLEQWQQSSQGLLPIESTMMVAIPELDGATVPTLFAGRGSGEAADAREMLPSIERIERLVARTRRLIALRRKPRAERRVGVVLFNFPPNSGSAGTAAFLAVFESLYNTLTRLQSEGYTVEVPDSVDALRDAILGGNAAEYGTDTNVLAVVPTDDHVRRERWLAEIEDRWGPAPGRHLVAKGGIAILGAAFGNVTVAVQPAFGFEGDPMRLLFEQGHAPTHAFSAFYRFLNEDIGVDALLNFGTHGALEFMPGKQVGMSGDCWPERLLGDTPNLYLYAANNPSEATVAKRRSAATTVSYLTPTVTEAGLYRGLADLRSSIERWRTPVADEERASLLALIEQQADELALDIGARPASDEAYVTALRAQLDEYELTLIPDGLHVIGQPLAKTERSALATAAARSADTDDDSVRAAHEREIDQALEQVHEAELSGLVTALDGGFVRPVVGGDVLKTADILPTGRNIHGFDPFRIPSRAALAEGARQADLLLERHRREAGAAPRTIAFVLWGTDNLKSEGVPIGQVLHLLGARPRYDNYGRLCGAELIPADELDRSRVDVVMTLSGIFRDLLPQQISMLAEACQLIAHADEPAELNPLRANALAAAEQHGCSLEQAALRVFSNADGAYGSNVNHLIDNGRWGDEDELADTYSRRKCYAFGVDGRAERQPELLQTTLSRVELAYQNIESVELGVTSLDNYFDTLGGITRAAQRASGRDVSVYIGDQTGGREAVRTLKEQVALETHTRMLNPLWYEGLLKHGYEGVRQIESHVTNTMGLSATTGQVDPAVYQQLTQLYVLDEEMRERLAALNPVASARVAGRLLEAHERDYWTPDDETLARLREAGDELDDRLEGINKVAMA